MAQAVHAQVVDHFADQRWRLNNLYWITDKEGQKTRFTLNWAQEELLGALHYLNLILKARQLGFSTFIQLYMLDVSVFYRDTRCGVIAHTKDDAEALFRDKIKFPYDNLPEAVRSAVPIRRDNTTTLELSNNSLIRVGTSLRGGTLQYLHVSEFGKICAQYPEKAREIVTGALNTIQAGQVAFIESTAEGREGRFFEMCEDARAKQIGAAPLTALDWKFHFFPWWREPSYWIEPAGVVISQAMREYFAGLVDQGISLNDGQKAWYAKKAETQGADMKREFPSTPKEAFEAAIEGAYYANEMARVRSEGRICRVPYDPTVPVNTFWDLGVNDHTAIWFHQRVGMENRFIGYYANAGEGLSHYADYLRRAGYTFGDHYLPHDVEVVSLSTGKSRRQTLDGLGIRPIRTVQRIEHLGDGIQAVRNSLASCWFDEAACAEGIRCLDQYRREWDERLGVWKDRPRHDAASHGADSFRQFAQGYHAPVIGPRQTVAPEHNPFDSLTGRRMVDDSYDPQAW